MNKYNFALTLHLLNTLFLSMIIGTFVFISLNAPFGLHLVFLAIMTLLHFIFVCMSYSDLHKEHCHLKRVSEYINSSELFNIDHYDVDLDKDAIYIIKCYKPYRCFAVKDSNIVGVGCGYTQHECIDSLKEDIRLID